MWIASTPRKVIIVYYDNVSAIYLSNNLISINGLSVLKSTFILFMTRLPRKSLCSTCTVFLPICWYFHQRASIIIVPWFSLQFEGLRESFRSNCGWPLVYCYVLFIPAGLLCLPLFSLLSFYRIIINEKRSKIWQTLKIPLLPKRFSKAYLRISFVHIHLLTHTK